MDRIQKLTFLISGVDGWMVEEPEDLYYLTGLTLSTGSLFVSSQAALLFVDGRYFSKAAQEAPCPVSLNDEASLRKALHSMKRVGFDAAFITYSRYLTLKTLFPHVEWVPLPNPVKQLRLIKDAHEIAALKKAAHLTWEGYQLILSLLKEGISEEETALQFEIFCLQRGASGLSFEPIIAFGENSAYPHHRAGKTRLQKNQLVLIDIGAIVDRYRGDMTRVFFFGNPDPRLVHFQKIVCRAQKRAVAHVKPGVKLGELDRIVREEFRKENVEELYTHSLGHGIGLETHEFPRIKETGEDRDLKLEPGMVFTIEPGLYQPGLGGIRYEDTVLVTPAGCENFYPGFE